MRILKTENLFVRFTALGLLSAPISCRIPIIAVGDVKVKLPPCAMAMEVHTNCQVNMESIGMQAESTTIILVAADLPMLCREFLRSASTSLGQSLGSLLMDIWIEDDVQKLSNTQDNTLPYVNSKLRRLLDPLRHLHSLNKVNIYGSDRSKYETDTIASMTGSRPAPTARLEAACGFRDEGMTAYNRGDIGFAINKFNSALHLIRGSCFTAGEGRRTLIDGPEAGWSIRK